MRLRFMARQPVFDSRLRVFGYELLFRAAPEDFARISDSDLAARTMLDNFVLWGLDRLCDGKRALVNCTRDVITTRQVEVLPPSRTVLEILEGITADGEMIEACRELKHKGYLMALDDVSSMEEVSPYVGVVQLVKIDFRLVEPAQQAELATWLTRWNITALAEKIETQQEFQSAVRMGYQLFQGFFLQRPELMRARDIPALHGNYVRLLNALQQPELDFALVEQVVCSEPSLCFRLLRFLNSPLFAFGDAIDSVRHALQLLGDRNVRNWLLIAMASSFGEDKPAALVVWALTRARFCELLGSKSMPNLDGMFLLGMLSTFSALLEAPLDDILQRLTISSPISDALRGHEGPRRDILDMTVAYESGAWHTCGAKAKRSGLSEEVVAKCYFDATLWADGVTASGSNRLHSICDDGPPDRSSALAVEVLR